MSSIAIITARGGSKRIPKKNIKEFCGKPIIAYSIEAALQSGVFDEVMVSTDSDEIKAIAEQYGASVPFLRSEATSNDFATTEDVLNEVLNMCKERGMLFDYFACLYPTAPFITAERLRAAFCQMIEKDGEQLISVVKFSFPPQRAFLIRDGFLIYQYPEYALKRSQDLQPIYHDCGQFYFYKTDAYWDKKNIMCDKTIPFILDEAEVQDIDTMSDWIIAENKMSSLRREQE